MNTHPAKMMLCVWLLCIATFFLLPYQLLERELSIQGTLILIIFIATFLVATLMVPIRRVRVLSGPATHIDASKAQVWLMMASVLATLCFAMDARGKDLFDLVIAYELRSEVADALLKGEASSSSVWFQVAFLLYPAGYVYSVVHVLYAPNIQAWKLALVGLLPIVFATLSMGGRVPIFYAVIVVWLALRERKKIWYCDKQVPNRRKWMIKFIWFIILAALFQYFATVFVVRASVAGGSMEMFAIAEQKWGVGFKGPMSGYIFAIFGEDIAYLIFIFIWYLVQGFVMSNYLFTSYDGPLQMGIYGVDLMSALVRRLDPQRLAEGFDSLLKLGTYGFLPSAWGSLYVDFGFYALVFCLLWGVFTALCYRRIVVQRKTDWFLIGPFATIGIIFSIINTPLGFTNGLVTHVWLLLAFLLLKRSQPQTAVVAL